MPVPDLPPLHLPQLRDYSRSRAVLIGNWDYTFLEPMPAAAHSLRRIADLLTGPLCGWPPDRVTVIANEPGPGDIPDQLITAYDGADDVALFYFVGHGQISSDDELCLGMTQSRPEANRRASTSLRFEDVRKALMEGGAATKIVILDCCYAGLATTGTLGGASAVLNRALVTGAYTMAATRAYAAARYEETPGLARPQTYFTKYLADVVERGMPGQPARLRLDPLFRKVRDNLAADHHPVPESRAVDNAREFVFAYNAAPPESQHDPEREVAQLSRRLAETTAQIETLTALAAERDAELAELRSELASIPAASAQRRDEMAEEIEEVARKVEELARRERAANRESVEAARQLDQARSAAVHPVVESPPAESLPVTESQSADSPPVPPSPGPVIRTDVVRRVHRRLFVRGAIMTALLGGLIAGLVIALPGGSYSSATKPPAKPSPTVKPTSPVSVAWTSDRFPQSPLSVAYGPGGTTLAVGTASSSAVSVGSAYLLQPGITARPVQYDAKGDGVTAVAFGPGDTLATLDGYEDLYLWSTVTGKHVGTFPDQTVGPIMMSAAPDGVMAVVGNLTGTVYLWNVARDKITARFSIPSFNILSSLAIAPDGDHAVVGDFDGKVYLCNTGGKSPILMRPGLPNGASVLSLAFAPDNKTVAVGADNGTTYLWDTDSGTRSQLPYVGGLIDALAFSPDGAIMAVGDTNGVVYFWDVRTRRIITSYSLPASPSQNVDSVAFSPDGEHLAVAGSKGYVYVWRITIG
jgi:outer membrane protein assembly factor BamB